MKNHLARRFDHFQRPVRGGSVARMTTVLAAAASVVVLCLAAPAHGAKFLGLGDLTGGSFRSFAYGVSANGAVVVGQGNSASGNEAFRWTSDGGIVGLGDFPGGSFSSNANGVSADGTVVVGRSSSASGAEAFRWTSGGGMVGLGDLTGGNFASFALGASADGAVIVGQGNSASGFEAFRWTSGGGMVGLGDFPGGSFSSNATAVSADGAVVVGRGDSAAFGNTACVWDTANQMQSVAGVLSPSVGNALVGWSLQDATAVSADGRTVVGNGTDPSGNSQAWLAYLADNIAWFPQTSGAWDSTTSWTGPFLPGAADDVVVDPTAALTVSGPITNRTVNRLQLGGSGAARVTLRLEGATGGDLNVVTQAQVFGDGELVLANGRSVVAPVLYNAGVIRGTGTINANLVNYAGGEVRVTAGEALVVSGVSHTNDGKIEVLGSATSGAGAIEFLGPLVNTPSTGLITGLSAVMRFTGGLTNNGSLALTAGINNVSGDITNNGGATITVTGGAGAVFYDDMVQNGTLRVVKVGSTTSSAVFLGSYSGAGATGGGDIFMDGDLRPGNSPASVTFGNNVAMGGGASINIELAGTTAGTEYDQVHVTGQLALDGVLKVSLLAFTPLSGQSFDILDWGSLSGTFATLDLPSLAPGLSWNTSQLYTAGILSVGQPGDFSANGVVDTTDYVMWRKRNGSAADYNTWRSRFGQPPGSGAGAIASAAVPEPASLVLLMFAAVGWCVLRCPAAR